MNQTGLKCNCVLLALYGATEASLSWCPLHFLSFLWGEVIVPETRTQGRWAGRMKEGAPHVDKIQGSFLPVTFLLQPQIERLSAHSQSQGSLAVCGLSRVSDC